MHAPIQENLTQNICKNVHLKYQYFGPFRQCVEKYEHLRIQLKERYYCFSRNYYGVNRSFVWGREGARVDFVD